MLLTHAPKAFIDSIGQKLKRGIAPTMPAKCQYLTLCSRLEFVETSFTA